MHQAKLATEGSVRWMFEPRGILTLKAPLEQGQKEKIELTVIDAGAEDMGWSDDLMFIYTLPEKLDIVKQALENKGYAMESAILGWKAKTPIEIDEAHREKLERFFEALDDYEDVQEIYSNLQ